MAREQRKRLQTIDSELTDVRRRLDRLYNLVETTDLDMADVTPRIRDHRERQERLETSAEEARAILSQRREVLDDVNTITAYAQDMSEFLNESELTERRAFIESFAVTKIPVSLPDSPVVGAPPFASAPGAMTVLADAARTLAYTLLPAGLQLNSPSVQHLGKSVRAQDVAYTYTHQH